MAQPLSIENKDMVYLITTRTAGSKLWLINNKYLEELILGSLARYQEIYGVVIYGFILMGNHYHLIAKFPNCNRAQFMRDFNSAVGRLVGRYVKSHGRRSVWARRYSYQVLPRAEDIRHWFYYVALNPVSSGLVRSVKDYPAYNSYFDAAAGRSRTVSWIDWSSYIIAKRFQAELTPEAFKKEYTLRYSRLPEEESKSQLEYEKELSAELYEREAEIVKDRLSEGKGFLGTQRIREQTPGALPRSTKTSSRYSFRPLVLTLCYETKKLYLQMYFAIKDAFLEASYAYRNGDKSVLFPSGTYPPGLLVTI